MIGFEVQPKTIKNIVFGFEVQPKTIKNIFSDRV